MSAQALLLVFMYYNIFKNLASLLPSLLLLEINITGYVSMNTYKDPKQTRMVLSDLGDSPMGESSATQS